MRGDVFVVDWEREPEPARTCRPPSVLSARSPAAKVGRSAVLEGVGCTLLWPCPSAQFRAAPCFTAEQHRSEETHCGSRSFFPWVWLRLLREFLAEGCGRRGRKMTIVAASTPSTLAVQLAVEMRPLGLGPPPPTTLVLQLAGMISTLISSAPSHRELSR